MPNVKMELTPAAYKEFTMMMKKMGYSDEDAFVKYCVLKTIKPYVVKTQQKDVAAEIKAIQAASCKTVKKTVKKAAKKPVAKKK
jgi:hypothetical protein